MTLEEVAERFGLSKRTVMRRVDQGQFPAPMIREGKLIVWRDDVIVRLSRRTRRKIGRAAHANAKRKPRPARNRVGKDERGVDRRQKVQRA